MIVDLVKIFVLSTIPIAVAAPSGAIIVGDPTRTSTPPPKKPIVRYEAGTGNKQLLVDWPASVLFPGKPMVVNGKTFADTPATRDQIATATDPQHYKCDWVVPGTPTTTCIGKAVGFVDVNVQFRYTVLEIAKPDDAKSKLEFMGAFWHPHGLSQPPWWALRSDRDSFAGIA